MAITFFTGERTNSIIEQLIRYLLWVAASPLKMTKGGGGFLTPKAISNRIKSKGLQKLRWVL